MKKKLLIIACTAFALCATSQHTIAQSFQMERPVSGVKVLYEPPVTANAITNAEKIQTRANIYKAYRFSDSNNIQNIIRSRASNNSPIYISKAKIKKPAARSTSKHATTVLYSNSTLFTGSFLASFYTPDRRNFISETVKTRIVSEIIRQLPKGYGIHSRTNLQLGTNISMQAGYFQHSISPSVNLEIIIPRNRLFVQVTTPSVFGSYADPNAEIFFDLVIKCPIALPTNTSQTTSLPKAGQVTATAINISKPTSKSIVSNLLLALAPIFGGSGFLNDLRKEKEYVFPAHFVDKELGLLRLAFRKLPPARIENYAVDNMLFLKATTKKEEFPVVK